MPATTKPHSISDYRCFFCFARAFEKLLEQEKIPHAEKNKFTDEMTALYHQKSNNFSAPMFSRDLHTILKKYSGNNDPYASAKKASNDLVLGMYNTLKENIIKSTNPFNTALRLAIAGNIIDFAISQTFNLDATLEKVLNSDFAIDDSLFLKEKLDQAEKVLYLGDNAGEIVFDKLFIETLGYKNITYAVRGAPIINDATLYDAQYVGIDKVAKVISNGYDAPSTIVEQSSAEFRDAFASADVVISKGQGNLEGLLNNTSKDVFFLLMVKCNVIAETLGVNKGDFVVFRQQKKLTNK